MPHTVRYTFKGDADARPADHRRQLPVLSKAYYATQPFEETSAQAAARLRPVQDRRASSPGTYVTYKRRDDYWAKDLPVNRGRYNFDEIRYDYYRDRNIELEAHQIRAARFARGVHLVELGDGLRHSRRAAKAG